jgi:hypothetical protein
LGKSVYPNKFLPGCEEKFIEKFGVRPSDGHCWGMIMGLKRKSSAARRFISKYYQVFRDKQDLLFMSANPEELVIDCLIPLSGFPEKVYCERAGLPIKKILERYPVENPRLSSAYFMYRFH